MAIDDPATMFAEPTVYEAYGDERRDPQLLHLFEGNTHVEGNTHGLTRNAPQVEQLDSDFAARALGPHLDVEGTVEKPAGGEK